MISILIIVGILSLLYYYIIKPLTYWSKKNVRTGKLIPIFGENLYIMLGMESVTDMLQRIYNQVSNVRYHGMYQFQLPGLIIKCPKLIKQICVKDFDHFLNHRNFVPEGGDVLMSKNLLFLKGQNWKDMRSILSPSFTSSKMKAMFVLMCQNANAFTQYFIEKNENIIEVEFKDAYTRYANDVIASAAFGIQVDSLKDRENEFYVRGSEVNFSSPWMKLVFFLYQCFPTIAGFFQITIFSKQLKSFFINLVKDTIKLREEQNIKRPDMLGLLIEARKGQEQQQQPIKTEEIKEASFAVVEEHLELKTIKHLSDLDIACQVFVFFLGGFETVSTAMCFIAYELAVNVDVQRKLIEEIDQNKPQEGSPSYEVIAGLSYMDMVISETLRKWPNVIAVDRVVTKPYTIKPELPEEKPLDLEMDTVVMVPIYAMHHDPRFYENPEKFDPERFSPENRNKIDPYTYLPFGVGPRNCIGSRFALLEMKAVFFYLLSHFEIVPVEKTNIPLKLSRTALTLASENGFPLGLKRRELQK